MLNGLLLRQGRLFTSVGRFNGYILLRVGSYDAHSEIAEEQGISRQGVHDLVKRCDKILSGYEEKLKLVEKFNQTKKMVEEIKELAGQYKKDGDRSLIDRIEAISEEIGKL